MKTYEEQSKDMTEGNQERGRKEPRKLPRSFHLEAEACGGGRMLLIVSGARRVLRYTTELLLLDLGETALKVEGRELLCRSFSSGVMEVKGAVSGVCFFHWENGSEGNFEGA